MLCYNILQISTIIIYKHVTQILELWEINSCLTAACIFSKKCLYWHQLLSNDDDDGYCG